MKHICKTIEKSDAVFIKQIDGHWLWCHAERPNTEKERVSAHEIKHCPYCGIELAAQAGEANSHGEE